MRQRCATTEEMWPNKMSILLLSGQTSKTAVPKMSTDYRMQDYRQIALSYQHSR